MPGSVAVAAPEPSATGNNLCTRLRPKRTYLLPGQLFTSSEAHVVTTVLGSCVAVCLWDGRLRAGGVNHYVLPHWTADGVSSLRFGRVAIEQLLAQMTALGGLRADLRAKVFGGAGLIANPAGGSLGDRNIQVAREVLQAERIPIVAEDVGGRCGRKLIFHTDSGAAWVRSLGTG
ncbi:MAG: chemotaxis protein CheD [Acidobacteriota bacterium]